MKKLKVLIVDDDHLIREMVKAALSHADFEAVTLESPALAETVIRRSKPELILLDLYMPELDGRALCRRLRSDPATKAIPIIILTASNETIDMLSGLDAGAVEYIRKPVDGRHLIEKIQAILDLKGLGDAG